MFSLRDLSGSIGIGDGANPHDSSDDSEAALVAKLREEAARHRLRKQEREEASEHALYYESRGSAANVAESGRATLLNAVKHVCSVHHELIESKVIARLAEGRSSSLSSPSIPDTKPTTFSASIGRHQGVESTGNGSTSVVDGASLADLYTMSYPRVWQVPANTIPQSYFLPLCFEEVEALDGEDTDDVAVTTTAMSVAATTAAVAFNGNSAADGDWRSRSPSPSPINPAATTAPPSLSSTSDMASAAARSGKPGADEVTESTVAMTQPRQIEQQQQPQPRVGPIPRRRSSVAWRGRRCSIGRTPHLVVRRRASGCNVDYSAVPCLVRVRREVLDTVVGMNINPASSSLSISTSDSTVVGVSDRRKVLARWPDQGPGEAHQTKLQAVLRSIAIDRRKREQWNAHVRQFYVDDGDGQPQGNRKGDNSSDRAGEGGGNGAISDVNAANTKTGSGVAASSPITGESLYWPARVTRLIGRFRGDAFDDSFKGLGLLQLVPTLSDVVHMALSSPMDLFVDVVFCFDEVSEQHRLRVAPNVLYPRDLKRQQQQQQCGQPSKAAMVVAAVRRHVDAQATATAAFSEAQKHSSVNVCSFPLELVAALRAFVEETYKAVDPEEARVWQPRMRTEDDCPLLVPETLPDIIAIANYSYTEAVPKVAAAGASAAPTPTHHAATAGTAAAAASSSATATAAIAVKAKLNETTISNSPISVYDILAGPTCQTQTIVFLRPTQEMVAAALAVALDDLVKRWLALHQALLGRLTAYEEQLPRLYSYEEHIAIPTTRLVDAPPLFTQGLLIRHQLNASDQVPRGVAYYDVPPKRPLLELPDPDTYESPFIADRDRADGESLPPEPFAPGNMNDEELRRAARLPQLQSSASSKSASAYTSASGQPTRPPLFELMGTRGAALISRPVSPATVAAGGEHSSALNLGTTPPDAAPRSASPGYRPFTPRMPPVVNEPTQCVRTELPRTATAVHAPGMKRNNSGEDISEHEADEETLPESRLMQSHSTSTPNSMLAREILLRGSRPIPDGHRDGRKPRDMLAEPYKEAQDGNRSPSHVRSISPSLDAREAARRQREIEEAIEREQKPRAEPRAPLPSLRVEAPTPVAAGGVEGESRSGRVSRIQPSATIRSLDASLMANTLGNCASAGGNTSPSPCQPYKRREMEKPSSRYGGGDGGVNTSQSSSTHGPSAGHGRLAAAVTGTGARGGMSARSPEQSTLLLFSASQHSLGDHRAPPSQERLAHQQPEQQIPRSSHRQQPRERSPPFSPDGAARPTSSPALCDGWPAGANGITISSFGEDRVNACGGPGRGQVGYGDTVNDENRRGGDAELMERGRRGPVVSLADSTGMKPSQLSAPRIAAAAAASGAVRSPGSSPCSGHSSAHHTQSLSRPLPWNRVPDERARKRQGADHSCASRNGGSGCGVGGGEGTHARRRSDQVSPPADRDEHQHTQSRVPAATESSRASAASGSASVPRSHTQPPPPSVPATVYPSFPSLPRVSATLPRREPSPPPALGSCSSSSPNASRASSSSPSPSMAIPYRGENDSHQRSSTSALHPPESSAESDLDVDVDSVPVASSLSASLQQCPPQQQQQAFPFNVRSGTRVRQAMGVAPRTVAAIASGEPRQNRGAGVGGGGVHISNHNTSNEDARDFPDAPTRLLPATPGSSLASTQLPGTLNTPPPPSHDMALTAATRPGDTKTDHAPRGEGHGGARGDNGGSNYGGSEAPVVHEKPNVCRPPRALQTPADVPSQAQPSLARSSASSSPAPQRPSMSLADAFGPVQRPSRVHGQCLQQQQWEPQLIHKLQQLNSPSTSAERESEPSLWAPQYPTQAVVPPRSQKDVEEAPLVSKQPPPQQQQQQGPKHTHRRRPPPSEVEVSIPPSSTTCTSGDADARGARGSTEKGRGEPEQQQPPSCHGGSVESMMAHPGLHPTHAHAAKAAAASQPKQHMPSASPRRSRRANSSKSRLFSEHHYHSHSRSRGSTPDTHSMQPGSRRDDAPTSRRQPTNRQKTSSPSISKRTANCTRDLSSSPLSRSLSASPLPTAPMGNRTRSASAHPPPVKRIVVVRRVVRRRKSTARSRKQDAGRFGFRASASCLSGVDEDEERNTHNHEGKSDDNTSPRMNSKYKDENKKRRKEHSNNMDCSDDDGRENHVEGTKAGKGSTNSSQTRCDPWTAREKARKPAMQKSNDVSRDDVGKTKVKSVRDAGIRTDREVAAATRQHPLRARDGLPRAIEDSGSTTSCVSSINMSGDERDRSRLLCPDAPMVYTPTPRRTVTVLPYSAKQQHQQRHENIDKTTARPQLVSSRKLSGAGRAQSASVTPITRTHTATECSSSRSSYGEDSHEESESVEDPQTAVARWVDGCGSPLPLNVTLLSVATSAPQAARKAETDPRRGDRDHHHSNHAHAPYCSSLQETARSTTSGHPSRSSRHQKGRHRPDVQRRQTPHPHRPEAQERIEIEMETATTTTAADGDVDAAVATGEPVLNRPKHYYDGPPDSPAISAAKDASLKEKHLCRGRTPSDMMKNFRELSCTARSQSAPSSTAHSSSSPMRSAKR